VPDVRALNGTSVRAPARRKNQFATLDTPTPADLLLITAGLVSLLLRLHQCVNSGSVKFLRAMSTN
jgi:hypothetical protein